MTDMTSNGDVIDFAKQLTRQIGFLYSSCRSYDEGFSDEGIRIATTIRILLHETKNSRPLLRHLKAMNITLASTCSEPSEKAVMYRGMGRITFSSNGVEWRACTAIDCIDRWIPVKEWWNQTVFITGSVRLTRKDIVLSAADKDGGAHVDAKLTPEYTSLMNVDGKGFWNIQDPQEPSKFKPVLDGHLGHLRQMGFELLNSPDLLELCKP